MVEPRYSPLGYVVTKCFDFLPDNLATKCQKQRETIYQEPLEYYKRDTFATIHRLFFSGFGEVGRYSMMRRFSTRLKVLLVNLSVFCGRCYVFPTENNLTGPCISPPHSATPNPPSSATPCLKFHPTSLSHLTLVPPNPTYLQICPTLSFPPAPLNHLSYLSSNVSLHSLRG